MFLLSFCYICFGLTDFCDLSDRMSDTFVIFGKSDIRIDLVKFNKAHDTQSLFFPHCIREIKWNHGGACQRKAFIFLSRQIMDVHFPFQQKSVGMDEPLIDAEGFPRADIDIYSVRHARHQIICTYFENNNITGTNNLSWLAL